MGFKTKEIEKEYRKKYYLKNKEKLLTKQKQYYLDNKEIYKKYYDSNKENIIQRQLEYNVEYDKTPMARANSLLAAYKRQDKLNNRGECDFDAKWIVENIFTQSCAHCGKTGWQIIGCNRLDNSKPHTKDNVEPCCFECNIKELKMERSEDGRFKKIMEHRLVFHNIIYLPLFAFLNCSSYFSCASSALFFSIHHERYCRKSLR